MNKGRNPELDLSRALVAIDSAVADACEELLPPEDCAEPSVAVRLESGLRGLRKLASGGAPDWRTRETAVLYSSWYQLGHVNLAYNVARVLVEKWAERLPNEKTLHVVDFGAGTSALPMAFELLRARASLPCDVVVHLVEPSKVLLEHGNRIFENLRENLGVFGGSPSLSITHPNGRRGVPTGNGTFCLMHAVYPDDEDMKHRVDRFVSRCAPVYGIATCNRRKMNVLTEFESSLLVGNFSCNSVDLSCVPDVDRTEYRKTLQYRRLLFQCGRKHFGDQSRVGQLLTRDVPLWPWEPTVREYVSVS